MSGVLKEGGSECLRHWSAIKAALSAAIESRDKRTRKAGNKLLRHAIAGLTGTYRLGMVGAVRRGDPLGEVGRASDIDATAFWHIPSKEELNKAAELLETYCVKAMEEMMGVVERGKEGSVEVWRRRAKNVEYSVRGSIEILNDDLSGDHPHEESVRRVVSKAGPEAKKLFETLRTRLITFVGNALSYVNTSLEPEFEYQRDPKGASSLLKITEVLIMSRGPKYCSNMSAKRGIMILDSRKKWLRNALLKGKSNMALMEKVRVH